MPNKVVKRGDKYRVVEADSGRVTKNRAGTAVDGGGHGSRPAAQRQVNAMKRRK